MRINVTGKVRRRSRVKLGPFNREWWTDENFSWSHEYRFNEDGHFETVAESIGMAIEHNDGNIFVRCKIRTRGYVLAECPINESRAMPFSVLSIAGLELSGRIEFLVGEGSSR